jgi:16S rRNA (uracil1498-N3)-methyltransferase
MKSADKLFYVPDISCEKNIFLPEAESQHAVKVLRLKAGDIIHLINGKGSLFEAEIINPHNKRCEIEIIASKTEAPTAYSLHIAIAPTKMNERFEWFLEKATEIGIQEITPIICQRSERKEVNRARSERVLVAAAKQSHHLYMPKLNEACLFEQFLQKTATFNTQKCIAHCLDEDKKSLQQVYEKGKDILVLIGPEGDFSEMEIDAALKAGFLPVSLGESRLRTETAGIVACHTIVLKNEEA